MINYELPEFKFLKNKKRKTKKIKDNIFGILTASILVSFLAGIIASGFFYEQIENSFAQLVESRADYTCDPRATQEELVVQIVEDVSPAVVNIIATKDVPVFEVQDGFFPTYKQKGTEEQKVGEGTGFIISKDGVVLTNKHVVLDEDAYYTILTEDGAEYSVEVVARDPVQDLAILKIKDSEKFFPTVKLGDSDKVKVGQTIIAIGNALGKYQNAVSVGVVSGLGRTIEASGGGFYETLKNVIQSDTAINKGNSGGPLLNLKGEVIGVNTAIDVEGQNIAFSIPINKAKRDVEQMKETGEIIYPFLGVRYVEINEFLQKEEDLPVDYGALILSGSNGEEPIVPDSAADQAGIKEGDIILELNNQKITSENTLGEEIMKYSPGEEINLKVLRNGEEINLKAILKERNI